MVTAIGNWRSASPTMVALILCGRRRSVADPPYGAAIGAASAPRAYASAAYSSHC